MAHPSHASAPVTPAINGLLARKVADVTGLSEAALYRLHAEDMGSPGHFYYPHGLMVYTPKGLCRLIEILDASGHKVPAIALREIVQQARQQAATAEGITRPCGWLATWEDEHP